MSVGFSIRRGSPRRQSPWQALILTCYPAVVTVFIGSLLATMLIGSMQQRIYPLLRAAARSQTENKITAIMERTAMSQLEESGLDYGDLVHIERLPDGAVTAVTTDMGAINQLRGALMENLLPQLSEIDRREIAIPIGNLLQSKLLWGRGPAIYVRSISVGSLRFELDSEFIAAGLNQTLHKIWLILSAPATVLLPGEQLELEIQTRLCVAETVIIGEMPDYLQK